MRQDNIGTLRASDSRCLYKITQDKINGQHSLEVLAWRMKACHQSLKVKGTVIEKEIKALQKENAELKKQNKETKQTMGRVQIEKKPAR